MSALYPLRLQPILRRYIWGGRRLATLGKSLGPESDYAESWEIVDRDQDQSVVLAGPLAGRTLQQLLRDHNRELLGRHAPAEKFPLLFKFLDAHDRLSIQVHPDDARAALLDPPDLGKTEAWVVLESEPSRSYLFAGLRRGTTREVLSSELQRRTVELSCHRIEPQEGDCYFLPAGVVHAIGPDLLVAEIQQASDTTYRLYDFDRLGPAGEPRQLHIEAALDCIDFDYGPVSAQTPQATGAPGVQRLVQCEKFVLDRTTIRGTQHVGGDKRFHILAVLQGSVSIVGDPLAKPLERGDVALLPAELGAVELQAPAGVVLLDAYLP